MLSPHALYCAHAVLARVSAVMYIDVFINDMCQLAMVIMSPKSALHLSS